MREGMDHDADSITAHGSFRGSKNTSACTFGDHSSGFREARLSSTGCTYPSPSPSTVQLWIKRFREKGLAGLANAARSDKGKSRSLPEQAITLVEGLALQTPPRSAASIHRQVSEIAKEQGWKPPSYERVRLIIKNLDPALRTLAHEGAAVYREEFDLLYRREATHSNAIWQADPTPLDILLLDEEGKTAKPYLT